ncbi:MAG: hypothetical protein HYY29_03925 [Chloroflexi bacterium]|nr:hypothetical protein [Chloroflexota bacterium]
MADHSLATGPNSASSEDSGAMPGGGPGTGTPRWVKIFGIIALVLILLVVVLHLTGRGFRGGHTPPSQIGEHGLQPPWP